MCRQILVIGWNGGEDQDLFMWSCGVVLRACAGILRVYCGIARAYCGTILSPIRALDYDT